MKDGIFALKQRKILQSKNETSLTLRILSLCKVSRLIPPGHFCTLYLMKMLVRRTTRDA